MNEGNMGRDLVVIALLPILMSILLHEIQETGKGKEKSYLRKQIVAGLLFGCLAIFATEHSIPVFGTLINVRDASPLCAGLIFGPIAGVISGLMGGIERWFCVYWGGGYYTRLGCTISTILTGLISGFLRKHIFEDKIPDSMLAFYSGVFCMTIHMSMIFITNLGDVKTAFNYVSLCALPMISLNTISVTFSVFLVNMIENDRRGHKLLPTISARYQHFLIMVVVLGLIMTSGFTFYIQRQLAISETFDTMLFDTIDAYNDLMNQETDVHLRITREMADDYFRDLEGVEIDWLVPYYNVSEMDVINDEGIIIDSSKKDYIGRHMDEISGLEVFFPMLNGKIEEYVPYRYDNGYYVKNKDTNYAGITYGDFLVVTSISNERVMNELNTRMGNLVATRRIGEYGFIMITDKDGTILAAPSELYVGRNISELNLEKIDDIEHRYRRRFSAEIEENDYYYQFEEMDSFDIYAFMDKSESDFSSRMSMYLSTFMLTIVFGILFIFVYYITKKVIVNGIDEVNESLDAITNGDLDVVVDVKNTEEFLELSDDINLTVSALKDLLKEANEKYDEELRTAKEIQESALPKMFPDRDEFDLYAMMDPARQVGGDFYDFYMIGSHTLVFLVADVSGKGIPASLFMMRAKTVIRNYAEQRISPGEILTNANARLCEGNDANMFVTAWIGILDLETGVLQFSNAGHNPPLIRKAGASYEYMNIKPGFVLAAFPLKHKN